MACLARDVCFGRAFAKVTAPDFVAGIRDHQSADDSSHAMSNQHDLLVTGERFIHPVEFFANNAAEYG